MNNFTKVFILFFVTITLSGISFAVTPTFELDAKNVNYTSSTSGYFDIVILHTNYPAATFNYLSGQFAINLDPNMASNLTFTKDTATYASPWENRIPETGTVSVSGNVLRVSGTNPLFTDFPVSHNSGTLIIRIKFTSASSSATCLGNYSSMTWVSTGSGFITKVFQKVGSSAVLLNNNLNTLTTHQCPTFHCCVAVPLDVALYLTMIPEGYYNMPSHPAYEVSSLLRSKFAPYGIVDSVSGTIPDTSWSQTLTFHNITTGGYYIVVKTPNTLETWSKNGGEIIGVSNYPYDFTTSAGRAYGNNLIQVGSVYCVYSGELNSDGVIDAADVIQIYNDLIAGVTGNVITDLNGDQIVDVSDLIICYNNVTATVSVIRP